MKLKTGSVAVITKSDNPNLLNLMDENGDSVWVPIIDLVYIVIEWQNQHGPLKLPMNFEDWKGVEGK